MSLTDRKLVGRSTSMSANSFSLLLANELSETLTASTAASSAGNVWAVLDELYSNDCIYITNLLSTMVRPIFRGCYGDAAQGPTVFIGARNFGKWNFLCAICEIYCAAAATEILFYLLTRLTILPLLTSDQTQYVSMVNAKMCAHQHLGPR